MESDNSTITLKNLYEKFSALSVQNSELASSRLMLKRLGFNFYIDSSSRYMVRLPKRSLEPKLRLMLRCLMLVQGKL